MIPELFIQGWRKNAEWQTLAQVEQDLVRTYEKLNFLGHWIKKIEEISCMLHSHRIVFILDELRYFISFFLSKGIGSWHVRRNYLAN